MAITANENNDRDFTQIPRVVIKRLFKYHSALERLIDSGERNISSHHLSEIVDVKASQLRKDLAYCGEFGIRGKGYDVAYLDERIIEILGLKKEWPSVYVGLGRLGHALLNYEGIARRGFTIKAAFDVDESKVGQVVHGIKVYHMDDIAKVVKEKEIMIGIITVPVGSAQEVCDQLVDAGVQAILNFAPIVLKSSKPVFIERVDISRELVTLSHYLTYHEH